MKNVFMGFHKQLDQMRWTTLVSEVQWRILSSFVKISIGFAILLPNYFECRHFSLGVINREETTNPLTDIEPDMILLLVNELLAMT